MWETVRAGSLKNDFEPNIKDFGFKYKINNSQYLTPLKSGQLKILLPVVKFLLIISLLFTASCDSIKAYGIYADNIFIGKALLKEQEYTNAEPYFTKASKQIKDSYSLAYLATVSYKTNNIDNAESYIKEAEQIDKNTYAYLRIIGYKALILLKKDKQKGLDALKDYINLYEYFYPLTTINDVRKMYDKKEIDMVRLENLIDEQILRYENDIDQFLSTKTGFYDRNSGSGF
jgi:tetratricopeptide (TPR) repeat protein